MKYINFSCCIKQGDILYGIAKYINLLCGWDIKNKCVVFETSIPEERAGNMAYNIFIYNEKIIVVPFHAKYIWVFSLKSSEWKKIEIKNTKQPAKFYSAFIYNDSVYMIGTLYHTIIKFNVITAEVFYFDEPYRIIKDKANTKEDTICFLSYAFKDNNTIYLPSALTNDVLEWNLIDDRIKVNSVGNEYNCFSDIIEADDNTYWLAPHSKGEFICWNGKEIIDSFRISELEKSKTTQYVGGYFDGSTVYFYGAINGITGSYDMIKKELSKQINKKYDFCRCSENAYIIQEQQTGIITIISEGEKEEFGINMSDLSDIMNKEIIKNKTMEENINTNLDWLLQYV